MGVHRTLVVAECLHAIGSLAQADILQQAVRLNPETRAAWVDDQWSGVVRFLAERLVRDAGSREGDEDRIGKRLRAYARALRSGGPQHAAQYVEMHCEMWSIDPRAACRMLGERLTPLLLSQVTGR